MQSPTQPTLADRAVDELALDDVGSDAAGQDAYREFVKPRLAELLTAIGLDVVYHRGVGDHLFYRSGSGEVRVLDLAGGFGASLFGHNHPYLLDRARAVLAAERPFHAQGSLRPRAGLLGQRLSRLVGEVTGASYVATFASTGAEAVEAALKHGELELWERAGKALERVRHATMVVRQRVAVAPAGFLADAARRLGVAGLDSLDALADALERRAHDLVAGPPTVLALTGAFHGKTGGALRLTHSLEYRQPWARAGGAVFLSRGDAAELDAAVARAQRTYFVLEVGADGAPSLAARSFCDIAAAFVEPIQGEGGIHEIGAEVMAALRRAADAGGFPLVIDEIQSGMGRTGSFLASEASGARGDYYLLSKSLGGGLAKISALLVDRSRYLPAFGTLHTSTFADDDFSCTVALAALDLIERDGRALLRRCRDKGQYLVERLTDLVERYPGQLRAVRGRGLLIGLELQPQLRSPSPLLRVLSEQRMLAFFAAGYLLHEERIRVAPTLSSHGTIRIEPSASIGIDDLDRFCDAVERLCIAIRDLDLTRFARFAFAAHPGAPALHAVPTTDAARPERAPGPHTDAAPIAFLLHYTRPDDVARFEPGLAGFDGAACRRFLDRTHRVLRPFVADRVLVRSPRGAAVDLSIIAVPFTADQVMTAMRRRAFGWALDLVKEAVDLAARRGCVYAGLGGYTSIVSNNARALVPGDLGLTTGNSLTVAAAVDALFSAAARTGLGARRLAVVGATGNIGEMLARLAADRVDELVLVGRDEARARLERLAADLPGARVATDLDALRDCNLIVSASNAAAPIVRPEHLHPTAPIVVCDVAVPGDVDRAVVRARPAAVVLGGGLLRLPLDQDLGRFGAGHRSLVYACMAETLLLGFAGARAHFSYGALATDDVTRIRDLAADHGFAVAEKTLA